MVMDDGTGLAQQVRESVEELEYTYVGPRDTRKATSSLRLHQFDLVILPEGFDGADWEQSLILRYLNHLSMSVRRKIFVVLIGNSFKTMDDIVAFALSANLVVNKRDLPRMTEILKRAISEHEAFYKVYTDTLAEMGKV